MPDLNRIQALETFKECFAECVDKTRECLLIVNKRIRGADKVLEAVAPFAPNPERFITFVPHSEQFVTAPVAEHASSAIDPLLLPHMEGYLVGGVADLATQFSALTDDLRKLVVDSMEGRMSVAGAAEISVSALNHFSAGLKAVGEGISTGVQVFHSAGGRIGAPLHTTSSILSIALPGLNLAAGATEFILTIVDIIRREKREVAGIAFFNLVTDMANLSGHAFTRGPRALQTEAAWKKSLVATDDMAPIYWFNFKYRDGSLAKIRLYTEKIGVQTLFVVASVLTIISVTLTASTFGVGGAVLTLIAVAAGVSYAGYRVGKYAQSVHEFEEYLKVHPVPQHELDILYGCLKMSHAAVGLLPGLKGRGATLGDWYRFQLARRLAKAHEKGWLNVTDEPGAVGLSAKMQTGRAERVHLGTPRPQVKQPTGLYAAVSPGMRLDYIHLTNEKLFELCNIIRNQTLDYIVNVYNRSFFAAYLEQALARGIVPYTMPSENNFYEWLKYCRDSQTLGADFVLHYLEYMRLGDRDLGAKVPRNFDDFRRRQEEAYRRYWSFFEAWTQLSPQNRLSGPEVHTLRVRMSGHHIPLGDILINFQQASDQERTLAEQYLQTQEEYLMAGIWEIIKLDAEKWKDVSESLYTQERTEAITLPQHVLNAPETARIAHDDLKRNYALWENVKKIFPLIRTNR